MKRQLSLLERPPAWQLDARTREIGRRGVAEARAALRSGRRPASEATEPPADDQRPAA